jgi:hypothetical protein
MGYIDLPLFAWASKQEQKKNDELRVLAFEDRTDAVVSIAEPEWPKFHDAEDDELCE